MFTDSNNVPHVLNYVDGTDRKHTSSLSDLYASVERAVVTIVAYDGSTPRVGSGFFSADYGNYIVTAAHNVIVSTQLKTRLSPIHAQILVNGSPALIECSVVGIDGAGDVALLKPSLTGLPAALPWGSSELAAIGSSVITIGNPGAVDPQSITAGVIRDNSWTETNGAQPTSAVITDYSAAPGNSGGPILDYKGRVIGVHTFGAEPPANDISGGPAQIVAAPTLYRIYEGDGAASDWTDAQGDYTLKGYLGIQFAPVDAVLVSGKPSAFIAAFTNIRGIQINAIAATGGIFAAGIANGSWILSIDGQDLGNNAGQVAPGDVTWFKKAGQTVTIVYIDSFVAPVVEQTAIITLADFPNSADYPLNTGSPNV
jgi:S1-C subfamily serine protease